MVSIGDTLKQARDKRGIAISDVHGATKITPQNLIALEEDRLDVFPNRVYARAFLRDYANFLGLDSAPLLEQYELLWSPAGPQDKQQEKQQASSSKSSDGAGTLLRAFAILVILVVVALAVWRPVAHFIQDLSRPSIARVHNVRPAPPEPKPAPTPIPVPTAVAKPKPPSPVPTPAPVPQGARLVVDTLTQSWISVVVDGRPAFEGILPPYTQKSWQGAKTIVFRTGNAGGVRLTFNGKRLAQIGSSGQIAQRKFSVTPTGRAHPVAPGPVTHRP
jgi:hypothetical protein